MKSGQTVVEDELDGLEVCQNYAINSYMLEAVFYWFGSIVVLVADITVDDNQRRAKDGFYTLAPCL